MNVPVPLESLNRSEIALFRDLEYAPPRGNIKRELRAFTSRYKGRLAWAFLIPLLLAIGVSFMLTPSYTGNAVMIIRLGPEYVYQTSNGVVGQQSQAVPFSNEEIFESEAALLSSDTLHREVVQAVGVDRLYPALLHPGFRTRIETAIKQAVAPALAWAGVELPPPLTPQQEQQQLVADAVLRFDKNLSVKLVPKSAVISVSFANPDSAVVQDVLTTLLRLYMQERQQVYSEQRATVAEQELQAARARLQTASQALEAFKASHDVINFPAQRDALLARRSTAESQVQQLTAATADDEQKLASLARSAAAAANDTTQYTDVGGDTAYAAARARLVEAQIKLKLAQEHYAPTSPIVQLAQREVSDISAVMHSAQASQTSVVRTGRTRTYDAIEQDRMQTLAALKGDEAKRQVVLSQVGDLDRQLKDFDSLDLQYNQLEQQVGIDRQSLVQFSAKLNDARSQDDADRTEANGVRVVQAPMVAPHPSSFTMIVIAGGAMLSLLVMLVVGAWTEFFRAGFLTPEELEREVGLTVLGVVPYRIRSGYSN